MIPRALQMQCLRWIVLSRSDLTMQLGVPTVRIAVLVTCVLLQNCCHTRLFADEPSHKQPESETQAVYSLEPANELLHLMFPSKVVPLGVSKVLIDPTLTRSWSTLEDTYTYLDDVQQPASGPIQEITFPAPPLESYWLMAITKSKKATELLNSDTAPRLEKLIAELQSSSTLSQSVLEKALLQRDLFQLYSIVVGAQTRLRVPAHKEIRHRIKDALASILGRLLLQQQELEELHRIRQQHSDLSRFRRLPTFKVEDNYLPERVVRADSSWWRMDFRRKYNVHYNHYRGRSFFHIYARIPSMSKDAFRDLWHSIAKNYGASVNIARDLPALPARSETLLIRTMGVILQDGTVADSGIVEEVLIRGFLTERAEFHPKSSDYRGTVHYQYILDRYKYLTNATDTGLIRIHDDDPAYIGFFPRAPDIAIGWTEYMNTARFNCINCHSQALHGTATVFSLGYDEVVNPAYLYEGHPFAKRAKASGRVLLTTPEFLSFWNTIAKKTNGTVPIETTAPRHRKQTAHRE